MKEHPLYNKDFFKSHLDDSKYYSIRTIGEFLLKIMPDIKTVVDIGCGLGGWLQFFKEIQKCDVLGIDGEWVLNDDLHIDKSEFLIKNLL